MSTDLKFTTAKAYMDTGCCPTCGETLSGDGYTVPIHCPNANDELWWYSEGDGGPWFCEGEEE